MFIRTKDEIYDLKSKEVSSWEYIDNDTARDIYGVDGAFYTIYYFDENKGRYLECDNKGGHSCDFIEEKDIVKQADTKEELCDEFVIHRKEHNYNFVWNEDRNIGLNYFCFLPEKYDVYGAVWVDGKGLIYVAKMNDEGKLVLI